MMTAPYLLIPIGLVLGLLYGFSLLFRRLEILSKPLHRKIWNYGLLVTFLTTALLGVLMAIQVNYKMEVPWTEKVLKWHVNFGIGMSLVGVFHLLWHLDYYLPLWRKAQGSGRRAQGARLKEGRGDETDAPISTEASITFRIPARTLPFIIGFSGILVQTLLIRELLSMFQGNELTLSIIIFLWLVITGAGSIAGALQGKPGSVSSANRGQNTNLVIKSLLVLPLVLVPLMYYLKFQLFAPGIEAGPLALSGFLSLVLLPYCFLNGFSFTWTARILEDEGKPLRFVYGWESIGGAAGGIITTLAILAGLPTLTVVFLASSLLFTLIIIQDIPRRPVSWVIPSLILLAGILMHFLQADKEITRLFYPNQDVEATRSGTSGRLTVTRSGEQINIYENGLLVHSSGNVIMNEELATFTLIQHAHARNVLIIGGLLSGMEHEIRKFSTGQIDFIETDPHVIRMADRLGLTPDIPGARIIRKTPVLWLQQTDVKYDAVMINLPGPQNLHLNRFYSKDFFRVLKGVLNPDGLITAVLPGTANYVSDQAIGVLGSVRSAAREVFENVLVLPGENSHALMSDAALSPKILDGIEQRGIANLYVNAGYFDEKLFIDRTNLINSEISTNQVSNTGMNPVACLSQIGWWLGHFPKRAVIPVALLTLLIIIFGVLTGKSDLGGMFLLGAASSGSEIIILLLVQAVAGSIYQLTGLFLGIFMAGLAAGSLLYARLPRKNTGSGQTWVLPAFVVLTALLGLIAPALAGNWSNTFLSLVILLFAGFAIPFTIGAFFAALSMQIASVEGRQNRLYGYDLLGSAVGAIAFPMVVIPLAGIRLAIFILSLAGIAVWSINRMVDRRQL